MLSNCCCRLSELIIMVLFSIIISFSLDYSRKVTSLLFCLLLPQMSFMKRYWTELSFLFISVSQFLILVLTSSYTFQMLDSALFFSSLSNFSFILASCSSCILFSSSNLAEYSKSSCCLMALSESSSQFWFCWLKLCSSFFLYDSIFCCEMAFILLFFAASSERQAFWSKPKILLVQRYSRYSSASLSLSFCAQVCLMERSYCSRAYAVAISIYLLSPFQNYCLSLLRVSQISRFLSYRCLSMRSFASLSLCYLSLNQLSFSCWYLLTFSCMSYQQTLLNSLFFAYNSFQYYFSSALMDSQSCSYIFALILSFSALILSYSRTSFCLPLKSWSISASYSCFNFFIRPSQRCLSSIQKSFHSFLSRQSYSSNSYSYYCYILGSSLTAGVDYATGLEENRLELLSLEAKRLELLFKLLEARPSWLLAFMFMDFRFFRAIFSFCCSYFLRYSRSVG